MPVVLCMAYYSSYFDDFDLDARSQKLDRGKSFSIELYQYYISTTKQAICIKLASTTSTATELGNNKFYFSP